MCYSIEQGISRPKSGALFEQIPNYRRRNLNACEERI